MNANKKKIVTSLVSLLIFSSFSKGHIYRGCAMARGTLKGWVVTSDTSCVLYTPNAGVNWYDQSFLAPRFFLDIFALDENNLWIGAYEGTIFYSNNGGWRWYRQRAGLSKWTARIFFINETLGWAACGEAIVGKTTCGTETLFSFFNWEQICLPNPPYSADSCDIYGIYFIDQNRGWFCAGRYPEYDAASGETLYVKGQGYIAKTIDGGGNPNTWQLLKRDTVYDFFDIRFIDSLTGFVVGGNDRTNSAVIMKTTNGGASWQIVSIPNQAKYLRALDFIGNRHGWAVGRNGTILHTNDGGNTWILQQSGVDTTLFDVSFSDTLHGLVAGNGYVLYTHNGGNTWNIALSGISEDSHQKIHKQSSLSITSYPNPFTNFTSFVVKANNKNLKGTVKIYAINGTLIQELPIISDQVIWNATNFNNARVTPGIYFAVFRVKDMTATTRIVYQK
jgi:photosystem II stability/assembly factor-like uncharacterized protein